MHVRAGLHRQRHRGARELLRPRPGQLIQGRLGKAAAMFVLAALLWMVWLGWIVHIWSIVDAARWKPGR
jgi:hypothetical protein